MIGAIIGDIVGSVFEGKNVKSTEIELMNFGSRITDDSVLTIAVADALLKDGNYEKSLLKWAWKYPWAGYGRSFREWMQADVQKPYHSWGNGSAMRVSSVAYAFNDLAEVLQEAKKTALPTHDHPEGIKGAEAIAAAIFLARTGQEKFRIKKFIEEEFGYDLNRTIEEIRPDYKFDVSCRGSVPEAIIAFLDSSDYESAIRLAISLGGDSDTIACMAGGIAEAFYKEIPTDLLDYARKKLPTVMKEVLFDFQLKYPLEIDLDKEWFRSSQQ
ncbi:ADP-ribosylglycohydrolase family protein [Christiangramia sabulilitoris]|uniref:ADP-ribosylglycohydrolase family protein n=1 Tax=Christiangramia sabulilitoris TaxID=2583991 RepID=A0A550I7N8_9FLAO|nr:ADP-ribosylglycohydrolase family protein [Christiangramia sabulilitoris]TRO66971.1 ADP-ribosylglycohydrolase family protein [Christiangramia sabulilitoris]